MRKIRLLGCLIPWVEMPFDSKFAITESIVERGLSEMGQDCAVAFSGGKDSLVVLDLVRKHYPDIPVIFNDTGVEYSETLSFVDEIVSLWHLNLVRTKPTKKFWLFGK